MANKKDDKAAADAAAAAEKDPPAGDPPSNEPPAAEPAKKSAKAKTVELKDKDTGFYDPVTGFQVVRDQQVKLGSTIGDATNTAIASGRLLIVD